MSVSMLTKGIGAAIPVRVVNLSMSVVPYTVSAIISRTSVRCPVTAAAAAIAGLIRWVRPPRP